MALRPCTLALFTGILAAAAKPSVRDLSGLSLEQPLNIRITGASLHPETAEEAPASASGQIRCPQPGRSFFVELIAHGRR